MAGRILRSRNLFFSAVTAALFLTGCTTLSHDVRVGNIASVEQKVSAGTDVNLADEAVTSTAGAGFMAGGVLSGLGSGNAGGEVPLHWAALNGYTDIAKVLLDHGAMVNAQDDDKATPLHWAVLGNHLAVAKLLVSHGADVGAKDLFGDTPLHMAADIGSLDMVNLLIASGANPRVRDGYLFLPQDYACAEWEGSSSSCPKSGIIKALGNAFSAPSAVSQPSTLENPEELSPSPSGTDLKSSEPASNSAKPWWQ
ncbi:MAG: ankyrin repeat domain-containing protein [Elusimicrobiota bacterium]